ncbi:hypothetical protein PPYR_14160 [Photinus pyralis]|uniref:Uncharacterized protein n=1 Tax=Photinus pyralis TaxID=7054 RepID=A0A1Y1K1K0_PHOPY|nr:uncharacterized protein LOC116180627 isoform X1 [Photinus pyralis]KAB0792201.1 hypothetical protein PPYR_14160 [Photinus pyralis]
MFLIASFVVFNIFLAQGNALGFYWREFDGTIPEDAFPAGVDMFNRPIYIGQALYNNMLIPATIYEDDKTAYFEHGGREQHGTENVKIFCTDAPDQFEWIRTNTKDIKTIPSKFLFRAGYEPNISTYIGRIRAYGEVLVGKVNAESGSDGLRVVRKGKAKTFTTNYDVLTYKQHSTIIVR